MAHAHKYSERHRISRRGWLRAAVLGANDGIVSTASLIVGMASADSTTQTVLLTGAAGLVAGAMSMAAGEYVSVSSQRDGELADLNRERRELETDLEAEREELANIYVARGLTRELARQVSDQLMAHDAIGAHARDELGISPAERARPVQAAFASAGAFASGAAWPLLVALLAPAPYLALTVIVGSIVALGVLGALAARTGGAPIGPSLRRVMFWGALGMGVTSLAGTLLRQAGL